MDTSVAPMDLRYLDTDRRGPEFVQKVKDRLTAVVGCLSLADARELGAQRRSHFAAEVRRQMERLIALVNDDLLLIVSRTRPDLYDRLRQVCADHADVEVIMDRRDHHESVSLAVRERRRHDISDDLWHLGVGVGLRPSGVEAAAHGV